MPRYGQFGKYDDLQDPELESETSFFQEALQFIGRPGAAVHSALMGDTDDAWKQLAGTSKKKQSTLSDVLRSKGTSIEKNSWSEWLTDVVGGAVTDPLSYATFGTGGLAKTALVGASKSIASKSLANTLKRGVRGTAAKSYKAAERALGAGASPGDIAAKAFEDTLQNTRYFRGLGTAEQRTLQSQLRANDWQNLKENVWDEVIGKWHREGEVLKPGFRMTTGIPGIRASEFELPGTRLAGQIVHKLIPFKGFMENLRKGFVSQLLDKTETTRAYVPEGLKYVARDYIQRANRGKVNITEGIWSRLGPEGRVPWRNQAHPQKAAALNRVGAPDLKGYREIVNGADEASGKEILDQMRAAGSTDVHAFLTRTGQSLTLKNDVEKFNLLKALGVTDLEKASREVGMSLPEIAFARKVKRNKGRWAEALRKYTHQYTPLSKKAAKDLEGYVSDIFKDLTSPNKGLLRTFLSGGRISLGKMAKAPKIPFFKTYIEEGKGYVTIGGFNSFWKPLMTSFPTNLPFHFRNTLGSIFMGAMDPDIGWSGITAMLRAAGGKLGMSKGFNTLHLSLHADQKVVAKATLELEKLSRAGVKIGGVDIKRFHKVAKRALGGRVSHSASDIAGEIGESFDLLSRHEISKISPRYLLNTGENMSNYIENHMRLNALHQLLKKGVPESEAIFRMQKQFVDYALVSETDRLLRDIFPFIKYQLGSLRWIKQVAARPRQIAWIGRAQQSQEGLSGKSLLEEQDPMSGEGKLFIPMPGGLRMGLGSGAEAVLNWGQLALGPREAISNAHPVYKLAMEYLFEKDLFTGQDIYTDRKAPEWAENIPGLVKTVMKKGDVPAKEMNAWVKKFIEASPLSRVLKTYSDTLKGDYWQSTIGLKVIKDFEKREQYILMRKLRAALNEKKKEGLLKPYMSWLLTYTKESTPQEVKDLQKYYSKKVKELGAAHNEERRKGRR